MLRLCVVRTTMAVAMPRSPAMYLSRDNGSVIHICRA